ncbi:AI-2E family transporter [Pseudomonas sp. GX19020]|uniref:AI-2E family transporter n=1 Tax=Pseudomonas sp. GX19020 TaxID=2942277 RepID=UPI002018DF27|nr:AI-2E family transporter [Pseudomonas sp. GX19020]MCL4067907.1 AI-2E family transporter [Pseudomonas sp. GX19020]
MSETPPLTESASSSVGRITLPRMATIVAVAAVLYVAQDVFLPIAVAMLIAFALSPLVSGARRMGLPMLTSVLLATALAFFVIGLFSLVVFYQLADLAVKLPSFQANIISKLDAIQSASGEASLMSRLMEMAASINSEISGVLPGEGAATAQPMPVQVVQPSNPLEILQSLVVPLVSPIATTGLVIVLVIFMLLERDRLRDRFIRLVGTADLHRTTQVLEEAGGRVGSYLLMQLLVNAIYALPIGIGLWLIGVPNAALWGLLTLVLRFVPYIGSVLAAAFPLFLAFAVSSDWSAVLYTAALFAVVELITSNIIEPWLYGANTGVSSLAIIVSAIFWTFLWGPLGLVLSTPLTVCLVVLGRHIPQFELFDILFGDEPVLASHQRFYQRLLSGDRIEAASRAEELLEDMTAAEFHRDVALPALLMAQDDRDRGVLSPGQESRLAGVGMAVVSDIAALLAEDSGEARAEPQLRITCLGGRWPIDDVSAAILAQSLQEEGAEVRHRSYMDLTPGGLAALNLTETDCVILCFLDSTPTRASLLHIRRIKRLREGLRLGIVIWQMPKDLILEGAAGPAPVDPAKLAEARSLGADFVETSLERAVEAALQDVPALPLPETQPRKRASRPRSAA